MANSDIDICTQALTLLRANGINSFNDGSNEADICKIMYADFAKGIISRYPWTFATKKAQLSRETGAPIGEYLYKHIMPGEALLIWAVFDTDLQGAAPIRDFDIYAADGSRRIYSNYLSLWADYTAYVDENIWPPYFVQFMIHALAAHIAVPVTQNAELAEYYNRMAWGSNGKGGLWATATSTDSMQKRNEFIFSSPITEARFQ